MTHRMITREPWKPGLGVWILVVLAFCLPFGIGALQQVEFREGLDRWVVKEKGITPDQAETEKSFPRSSRIVLTWSDSHIDDPRVEQLANKLRSRIDADGIRRGGLKQIREVESPRTELVRLIEASVPLDEGMKRLEGHLIGLGDLRLRLSEAGREQPEFVRRLLREGAKRDLKLELRIDMPFEDALIEEGEDAEENGEAESDLPEMIVSADYDFRVRWEGMHQHPEQIEQFNEWLNGLSLPTVGVSEVGDSPVNECFAAAGSPAALVLHLSEMGEADPRETLSQVGQMAESLGISSENLRFGGIPVIETALQDSSRAVLWNTEAGTPWYRRSSLLFSLAVLVGLTWWFVRNPAWTAWLIAAGFSAVCVSILIPSRIDSTLGLLSMLSLILVFAAGLCVAQPWLHLERLYVSKGIVDPSKTARLRSWFPCFLGVLCLLAGSLTIRTYQVPPFKEFSLCFALGMTVVGVLVLYGLPQVLSFIRTEPCAESKSTRRDWVHLGKLFARYRYAITACLTTLLVVGVTGLQRVNVENLFLTAFPADSEPRTHAEFIDERLCGTIPVETVVVFESAALETMDFPRRLDMIRTVSRAMRDLEVVTGTQSLADLIPEKNPESATVGEEKLSRAQKLQIAAEAEEFEEKLRERADFNSWCRTVSPAEKGGKGTQEVWRIVADSRAEGTPEKLMEMINGACQSVTRYHPGVRHVASTDAILSLGNLESLKDSAVVSLGVIVAISAAILLILLHNPVAAGLALVPIFLGCLLSVGIASWMGRPIGPMQLLALPFVLGMNAFLTVNLLAAFYYHLQNGRDRMAAAAEAFGDLAPVMCHLSIIVGAGIGVLGFAEFGMVREFGLSVLGYTASSFAINLLGIPALCSGWLGMCLESNRKKVKRQSSVDRILEETLPRELPDEIVGAHANAKRDPKRRRIDSGPKKIA